MFKNFNKNADEEKRTEENVPAEAKAIQSVICPRCKTVVKIKPGHKVACPLCNTTLEAK